MSNAAPRKRPAPPKRPVKREARKARGVVRERPQVKRGTSKTPGVVIETRKVGDKVVAYRMRWRDPVTRRITKRTLGAGRYPEDRDRFKAAYKKSLELQVQREDKREGIVSVPISQAVSTYLATVRVRLRARTAKVYTAAAKIFETWCDKQGIRFARELTGPYLRAFRTARLTLQRVRGERVGEIRAFHTINSELRAVHTMVDSWRRDGWTPLLTSDLIGDGLRSEPVGLSDVVWLRQAQCRALLRRALEHDRLMFIETRKEHRGKGEPGTTPRYAPVAPAVAVLLCTGMRFSEALHLQWSDISFDENTITLTAARVKTKRTRRFNLELAPALKLLLQSMDLQLWQQSQGSHRDDRIFGEHTHGTLEAARRRLHAKEAADRAFVGTLTPPMSERDVGDWHWHMLRKTVATALANMSGVGPFKESKLLGHSVVVAEARYAGLMKVAPDVTTIEKALGIESEMLDVIREARY